MSSQSIDAAIVGGGIAGLWALNVLRKQGYNAVLFESNQLGSDQTLASQGMIHGGLKYALSGVVNGASEAIADMPRRWRACLAGTTGTTSQTDSSPPSEVNIDLHGLKLLSDQYYMFAAGQTLGRLTTFFASRALRGRIRKVTKDNWPAAFSGFDGTVYELNDFVVDTPALLARLANNYPTCVLQHQLTSQNLKQTDQGYIIQLSDTTVHAQHLISCAGNGSAALLDTLGIADIVVQQRPLKQVVVKPKHNLAMYAHCLTRITGNEPRMTITTHQVDDQSVWYLGGQLATAGVDRSDAEQIEHARKELEICLPWLDWQDAEVDVLYVNRAEPKQDSGLKPDQAYVARRGSFVQCFPTKLTLSPDMGDQLLAVMDPPQHSQPLRTQHKQATIGVSPW